MSEGIDFKDNLARGIIVVGMPFPDIKDEVRNLVYNRTMADGMTNKYELFENKCMKTVNQTIGRAFRHKGDFAAAVLIDSRYSKQSVQSKLSKWISRGIKTATSTQTICQELQTFFRNVA